MKRESLRERIIYIWEERKEPIGPLILAKLNCIERIETLKDTSLYNKVGLFVFFWIWYWNWISYVCVATIFCLGLSLVLSILISLISFLLSIFGTCVRNRRFMCSWFDWKNGLYHFRHVRSWGLAFWAVLVFGWLEFSFNSWIMNLFVWMHLCSYRCLLVNIIAAIILVHMWHMCIVE